MDLCCRGGVEGVPFSWRVGGCNFVTWVTMRAVAGKVSKSYYYVLKPLPRPRIVWQHNTLSVKYDSFLLLRHSDPSALISKALIRHKKIQKASSRTTFFPHNRKPPQTQTTPPPHQNDVVLANRPHFLPGKYIGYNNTTVGLSNYGDHWRNLRRIIAIEVLSSHRLNCFSHGSCESWLRTRTMALPKWNLNQGVIRRMVSGKRYYVKDCDVSDLEEAKKFREIIKEIVALGGANNPGDFLAILRWFDFGGLEKRLKRISKRTMRFYKDSSTNIVMGSTVLIL
ncbi:hypothetical protein Fmac_026499 [Flemingia macrophylla]|uniref:Cytochrome P450 n=1 Tax=Flemingia macrophylla TaxID=520843 RepID=A0ABD1LF09_9FABA